MFGFLVANNLILSKQERSTYRQYYCGLCHQLNKDFGNIGRKTLTYDFTYINMLFQASHPTSSDSLMEKCPLHLLSGRPAVINEYTKYCSDMNIYLSYFKFLDDIQDSHSSKAEKKAQEILPYIAEIEMKYPEIVHCIKTNMALINQAEQDYILNPEIGSNAFGNIMAELLNYPKDDNLKNFGFYIGKFIYLMDAVIDLKDDLKNENYNPLVQMDSSRFPDMLESIMDSANRYYLNLELNDLKPILDNVIYSGIWSQYNLKHKEGKQ